MFEWPISEYPSGHIPQTESRLPPKGTHWTKVGSPSLQISGALVTPVVAYPSGQAPQVLRMDLSSSPSPACRRLAAPSHNSNPQNAIPTALPNRYRVHPPRELVVMDYPLARSLSASRITSFSPCAAAPDFSIFFSVSLTIWKPIPKIDEGRQCIFIERIAVRSSLRFSSFPDRLESRHFVFQLKRDSRRGLSADAGDRSQFLYVTCLNGCGEVADRQRRQDAETQFWPDSGNPVSRRNASFSAVVINPKS